MAQWSRVATAVLEPDGDKTTNVTVNGNGAVAHTARIVSGPGSLMVNPGAAPEFTSLSHGVSGNLTDNRTVEVNNAPELGRTAPSRDRGAVNVLEGPIAIASVMLVLEYLTENFKLASDANAGTLIADPPASPDAEVAAVSETRSIKVADTADRHTGGGRRWHRGGARRCDHAGRWNAGFDAQQPALRLCAA